MQSGRRLEKLTSNAQLGGRAGRSGRCRCVRGRAAGPALGAAAKATWSAMATATAVTGTAVTGTAVAEAAVGRPDADGCRGE